jgi:acyl-coenzyme A synthetase/AMP-(fatty) acid ligase
MLIRDASEPAYPILRRLDDSDVVARRSGRAIRRADVAHDVAAIAARLPDRPYVLNLCTDRYRFIVGFIAALCRRQITLLPPSDTLGVLRAVADDYPDLYALTDAEDVASVPSGIASLVYPNELTQGNASSWDLTLPGEQVALILFTSGSTGRPKPIPKSWGVLARSALAAGDRLNVAGLRGATLIGTVPHQHSYGLESAILLGLQHGLTIDAWRPLYPGDIRAAIEGALRPRILVTTPVHLRALVAEPDGMPTTDLIVSATAPLPMDLAAQAEACFRAPLVEIYGCTEAGQIATRRTTREVQWECFDGVELGAEEDGTWASGPAVPGRALLHDVIELTGPGTFLLGGRSADLVDVAGKRASIAHLNHQLLSIEGVQDGIFFVPEADGRGVGRLIALAVAPGLTADAIQQTLRSRIDTAFLPRPLLLVEALPRNALGKLPREALLRLARRSQVA